MKAKGLNPKDFEATKTREVPTGKKELMEFLTFYAVDVYRIGGDTVVSGSAVDVEALRAQHNPDPGAAFATPEQLPHGFGEPPAPPPLTINATDLTTAFEAAPIKLQAELAVGLIDRLTANT